MPFTTVPWIERFDARTVTKEDLESVAGVGPKRAAKMWETLNGH